MTIDGSNFHIITGGPGAGKTTIIEALLGGGFRSVDEVGREITKEQVKIGGNAVHWGDRRLYTELMLSRSMRDYERAGGGVAPVFFDRGIPELTGYYRMSGTPVPPHLEKAVRLYRYGRKVFVTPPWKEIYQNDAERKQDFAEAVASCEIVVAAYVESGYEPVEVPRAGVAERVAFILAEAGIEA